MHREAKERGGASRVVATHLPTEVLGYEGHVSELCTAGGVIGYIFLNL